eukprot:m.3934 g.3934  ORF g.3934 m.3934 type:complete len:244 (-) comp3766_c0_seq1:1001-1732(-)
MSSNYHFDFGEFETDETPRTSEWNVLCPECVDGVGVVVFGCCKASSSFLDSLCVEDKEKVVVGSIEVTSFPLSRASSVSFKMEVCTQGNLLLCKSSGELQANDTRPLVEKVFNMCNITSPESVTIIALTTSPAQYFQSVEDTPSTPFLRSVVHSMESDITPLEMPNAIQGVPAAALGEAKWRGCSSVLCISYSDYSPHQQLGVDDVNVFKPILPLLNATLDEKKVNSLCSSSNSRPKDMLLYT